MAAPGIHHLFDMPRGRSERRIREQIFSASVIVALLAVSVLIVWRLPGRLDHRPLLEQRAAPARAVDETGPRSQPIPRFAPRRVR
jgi:hypothetical protein